MTEQKTSCNMIWRNCYILLNCNHNPKTQWKLVKQAKVDMISLCLLLCHTFLSVCIITEYVFMNGKQERARLQFHSCTLQLWYKHISVSDAPGRKQPANKDMSFTSHQMSDRHSGIRCWDTGGLAPDISLHKTHIILPFTINSERGIYIETAEDLVNLLG